MAICTSVAKQLQEVTGICHGRVYPVAKNKNACVVDRTE